MKAHNLHIHSLLIIMVVSSIFSVNLLAAYPGVPNFDSTQQYAQAVTGHFTDWHPPIMAWVWSLFRLVADGSGPLFTAHVFCYWLGFGLIALTLSQLHRKKTAWAVIAAGAFPPFLLMNTDVVKNVSMATTFLSAFSICFFYRERRSKIPLIYLIIAMGLIIYGALVRANGIFAAAPLFFYAISPGLFRRPIYFIIITLVLTATWIPAANFLNHRVLRAEATYPINSLKWFDLTGIAYFSGDESIFGGFATEELVQECYTPIGWDTLWDRDICHHAFTGYWPSTKTWTSAIITHPMAYAEHRLAHLNSELFFIVPRDHTDFRMLLKQNPGTIASHLISKLTACGSIIGIVIVALCYINLTPSSTEFDESTACIGISGVMYTLAYLIVGVSTSAGYQYWSLIATSIALIIFLSKREPGSLSRPEWVGLGVLAVAVIAIVVVHAGAVDD
jgi:hypothetical protein